MYGYAESFLAAADPAPMALHKAIVIAALMKHMLDYPHHTEVRVSMDAGNRMLWLNETLYTFKELGF